VNDKKLESFLTVMFHDAIDGQSPWMRIVLSKTHTRFSDDYEILKGKYGQYQDVVIETAVSVLSLRHPIKKM
jgi:hypothetical protein